MAAWYRMAIVPNFGPDNCEPLTKVYFASN